MSPKPRKLRVEIVERKYKGRITPPSCCAVAIAAMARWKTSTVGNLSDLPADVIEFIERQLNGELQADAPRAF